VELQRLADSRRVGSKRSVSGRGAVVLPRSVTGGAVFVPRARSRPALRLAVASGVDLAAAIDAFLSQPDLASTTRAKYRQTLTVREDELGDAPITDAGLAGVIEQRWHASSRSSRSTFEATWSSPTRSTSRAGEIAHCASGSPSERSLQYVRCSETGTSR